MDDEADRALLGRYVEDSPLSLREIARRIGISPTQVTNYINGTDNRGAPVTLLARRLAQFADLFGITPDELREVKREDAVKALSQIDRIKGGSITSRLEKLRDQVDVLIAESRVRGL